MSSNPIISILHWFSIVIIPFSIYSFVPVSSRAQHHCQTWNVAVLFLLFSYIAGRNWLLAFVFLVDDETALARLVFCHGLTNRWPIGGIATVALGLISSLSVVLWLLSCSSLLLKRAKFFSEMLTLASSQLVEFCSLPFAVIYCLLNWRICACITSIAFCMPSMPVSFFA